MEIPLLSMIVAGRREVLWDIVGLSEGKLGEELGSGTEAGD